jgi:hypothetical protein
LSGSRVSSTRSTLVAEGPTLVDHIKGSTLHNLRNSARRGAPPTSGSCSSSSETPSGASDGRRQGRELEGRYDTKIPIAEHRYGQWIKKQEDE